MTVKEKLENSKGKTVLLIFNTGKTTRLVISEVTGIKVKYLINEALLKLDLRENKSSLKKDIITGNSRNYHTCEIDEIKDVKGNWAK